MPVFSYKCENCNDIQEIFQNTTKKEVICKKCASRKCVKLLGKFHSKVKLNAKDTLEEIIKPEVDKTFEKLESGNDSVFLDILGE